MEFKRERYLKQLIDGMESPLIKVVTGIRRCGIPVKCPCYVGGI